LRELFWVKTSKKDLRSFPEEVKSEIGYSLRRIQEEEIPNNAKRYKTIAGVMELISNFDRETYRVYYAYNIDENIYVLHAFQKKSKSGIGLPKKDKNLIDQRYKEAKRYAKENKKI
jgi:phage-related protein